MNNNILIKSIAEAARLKVSIENLSQADIIGAVDEVAQQEFLEKNYPKGAGVDLDDNICECEFYNIGERRCSCGNRRISYWATGNIVDGYYLTMEPH